MKTGVIVKRDGTQVSNVIQEFSRFAHRYDQYNMIQAKVANTLVKKLPFTRYKNVLDIGCGSGEVFKNFLKQNISVEHFIAFDSSQAMLNIHPGPENVLKICSNFNAQNFLEVVPQKKIDMIISASSLQWSTDIDFTIKKLSELSDSIYAAIFTSGTFKTLHETADINSPIYNTATIQEIVTKHYSSVNFRLHQYSLNFKTTRDMFKYIKQSGVSSGERKLSYKQTKQLMKEYPLDYLEFEVLFIEAKR